jgi:hypothetical protein
VAPPLGLLLAGCVPNKHKNDKIAKLDGHRAVRDYVAAICQMHVLYLVDYSVDV